MERVFQGQEQAEVTLYWVPPGKRSGPWQARTWYPWADELGAVRREVVTQDEFVCIVQLQNDALTPESLEQLTLHGINASATPHRDSSLPPRSS